MANGERLAKLEGLLKALGRDVQQVADCELSEQMGRTAEYALELLSDYRDRLESVAADLPTRRNSPCSSLREPR